jgi:hypothetical protein
MDKEIPTKLAEMSMQYSNATAPEDEQPDDAMQVDQAISKLVRPCRGSLWEGILISLSVALRYTDVWRTTKRMTM